MAQTFLLQCAVKTCMNELSLLCCADVSPAAAAVPAATVSAAAVPAAAAAADSKPAVASADAAAAGLARDAKGCPVWLLHEGNPDAAASAADATATAAATGGTHCPHHCRVCDCLKMWDYD